MIRNLVVQTLTIMTFLSLVLMTGFVHGMALDENYLVTGCADRTIKVRTCCGYSCQIPMVIVMLLRCPLKLSLVLMLTSFNAAIRSGAEQ